MRVLAHDHPTVGQAEVQHVIALHKGLCPALALGIQVSRVAIEEVGVNDRDHEVIAVAEGDTCALDAVQALTGCTLGNRDLVVVDHGKLAFTFWRRADRTGVRISARSEAWNWDPEHLGLFARAQAEVATPSELERFRAFHRAEAQRILDADPRSVVSVGPAPAIPPPRPFAARPSVPCAGCGELVTPGRTRPAGIGELCIPCAEAR